MRVYMGMFFHLQRRIKLNTKCPLLVRMNNLLCVYVHQVAGIKGMLIANKRQENQVKTYITYNKGRDWRLLQAPANDLDGNDIHCILVRYMLYILYLQNFFFFGKKHKLEPNDKSRIVFISLTPVSTCYHFQNLFYYLKQYHPLR